MKIKHTLLLLLAGFCLEFLGAWLKIMHTKYADLTLMLSMVFKILGAILFCYKILVHPKLKQFMNS